MGAQTLEAAVRSAWDAASQAVQVCGKPMLGKCPEAVQDTDVSLRFAPVAPIFRSMAVTCRNGSPTE